MRITVKTTFDFEKLATYIEFGHLTKQAHKILGGHIVEASKRFIMQGKVKPALEKQTIRRRKRMGITQNAPLFRTGELANSLKPVKEGTIIKGIKGSYYGTYHLEGDGVPVRNFIVFEKEKIRESLKVLMKHIGRALKK